MQIVWNFLPSSRVVAVTAMLEGPTPTLVSPATVNMYVERGCKELIVSWFKADTSSNSTPVSNAVTFTTYRKVIPFCCSGASGCHVRRMRDDELSVATRFLGVPLGTTRERESEKLAFARDSEIYSPANLFAYYLPLW